jgi:hypothetical protein
MRRNFTWQRKWAHLSVHCCSKELANTFTPNWSWKDCKLTALCFIWPFFNWHFFVYIHKMMPADSWFWLAEKRCLPICLVPTPDMFITMGQLEIEFEYWSNVENVGETDCKVYKNLCFWKLNVSLKETWDNVYMLFIVEIMFGLDETGWADETVDCAVRWNRVNRHFNVIDLAGGNLWNRHQLECGFNQSAFRIRPTCCINFSTPILQFISETLYRFSCRFLSKI